MSDVSVAPIGEYGEVGPRLMACVIVDDKKVAECYTDEDAKNVAAALRGDELRMAQAFHEVVVRARDLERAVNARLKDERDQLLAKVERLRAELAAAQRDAERYRGCKSLGWIISSDDDVDAAMANEKRDE